MKISIVIPAYNAEKYIISCLESVRMQNYMHWECIIIDDCSTDSTPQLIREFIINNPDYDFKYKRNVANIRQGLSRNYGVSIATGDYLMFMDSDDILPVDSLTKLSSSIVDNEDLIIGNYASFYDGHLEKLMVGAIDPEKFFIAREQNFSNIYNLVYPWAKLYRMAFWRSNNFQYKNVLVEDTVIWSSISSQAKSIKVISDVIYYYRIGNLNSESHLIRPNVDKFYLTLDARLQALKQYNLLDSYYLSFCLADAYHYINDLPFVWQRYRIFNLLRLYVPRLPKSLIMSNLIIPRYKTIKLERMYRYGLLYFICKPKTNILKLFFRKLKQKAIGMNNAL
ncbi:MAG: glycosyltransferase family 2 protein [Proteobacteria bacterium]|nr:MAG: glycosyltransferase family 2 protein [Pseudomonadota bacterium]